MKTSTHFFIKTTMHNLFILGFMFLIVACNNAPSKEKTSKEDTSEDVVKFETIYWNVKAIQPNGQTLDIKMFDNAGDGYDVKAIQDSDQDNLMDVKAFVNGDILPVKILVSKNQFTPVVAITETGTAYKLKAVTPEGEDLEIIGVARYDNIVIVKALTKKGKFYGVKAIAPTGELNDIKGIKINSQEREMTLRGHSIFAHVKAMHPSENEDNFILPKKNVEIGPYQSDFERIAWRIQAITPEGKNLNVKAIDGEGNTFDVLATQDSKEHSFLNIKAFVDGAELPVKIMQKSAEDKYAPIKAIGKDGTIYDVKALTEDQTKLDIKGISRSGNIIHVKAVNENGDLYGVKAFAPDGKLNAVKGIKIFDRAVEMKIQGHPVYAHLKAINQ
ncbi:DUF7486 family protein [Aestuariivivens sediminicola]|uniref:DUF7486 family protein n=1 Tax=Aestuariivivens sediminicola TaxID=2913560 RepID=UPI001F57ED19|nr:hypothetical protein [Aestuariivivens sediminicola]